MTGLRTTAAGRADFLAAMPPRKLRPAGETPGAAWWVMDLCDDITDLIASAEKAEKQLRSLLDFAEGHQLSHVDHDHDCYELWCIERDYTRNLIEGTDS